MNRLLEVPCNHATSAPATGQTNPSHRILVVEDDIGIRQLYSKVLIRSGCQVDGVEDGAAGWEALQADNYDLLITDHNMPKLTGVELVKQLRAARMELPVILVTGVLPTEEMNRNPWLQLASTLLKPFSPDQLVETVAKVLHAPNRAGAWFPVPTEDTCPSSRLQSGPEQEK